MSTEVVPAARAMEIAPTARVATSAYLTLCLTMLFWSGNAIAGKALAPFVPPFMLALVRWSGALLLIAPFAWPHVRADWPVLKARWRSVLLLGFLGVACFNALLYTGLHYTTATNSLLLQAAIPPLVMVINYLAFRDRSLPMQVVGVMLSTLGVVLVVTRAELSVLVDFRFGVGDLLVLFGVLAWAVYTSFLRLKPPVHGLSFLFATFVVGVVAMAGATLTELDAVRRVPFTPTVLLGLAYVCVFPSVLSYLFFNRAVGIIGAGKAGQTISLMPLFGAFLAAWLLSEPLETHHLIGMALILSGILLSGMARPKRENPVATERSG